MRWVKLERLQAERRSIGRVHQLHHSAVRCIDVIDNDGWGVEQALAGLFSRDCSERIESVREREREREKVHQTHALVRDLGNQKSITKISLQPRCEFSAFLFVQRATSWFVIRLLLSGLRSLNVDNLPVMATEKERRWDDDDDERKKES